MKLRSLLILYILPIFILNYSNLAASEQSKQEIGIYVISNGYHTGIIVPAKNEVMNWHEELKIPENTQFIEFGWGDKEFYMNRGPFSLKYTLKAIAYPTESVMHVVFLNKNPAQWFPKAEIVFVPLTVAEYQNLAHYIEASFYEEDGIKINLGPGLYGPSFFYTANGKYHLFKTCNSWVAQGLKKAGKPTSVLPLTAGSVIAPLHKK